MVEFGLIKRCHQLEARVAAREELLWLHQEDYIDLIASSADKRQKELNQLERKYNSIFICPDTQQAALLSAGSAMQIVESILSGESQSGVGIIRPPGHHAECGEAYGFCFYNNTALAAKYAIEMHGLERFHLTTIYSTINHQFNLYILKDIDCRLGRSSRQRNSAHV